VDRGGKAVMASADDDGIEIHSPPSTVVMPGLDPGIHSAPAMLATTLPEWIAGSSPAMTTKGVENAKIFANA
jgi:hypothetical protein